jgi:hypothetical protein
MNLAAIPRVAYAEIRAEIRSGDLLLCSGSSLFSSMIQRMTESLFSHVAFLLREENIDRIMVLESVESIGVQTVPLTRYLTNYDAHGHAYPGRLWIGRHAGFAAIAQDQLTLFSQGAVDLFGTKYDTQECLGIMARIVADKLGFLPQVARSNRTFICSEYAALCYQSVGIIIDYDRRGFIAPADFVKCPEVSLLWEIDLHGAVC